MRRTVLSLALLLCLVALATEALAVPQQLTPPPLTGADLKLYGNAFKEAERGNWKAAHRLAARASNPLGVKVLRWMDYSRPFNYSPFEEIRRFIEENPDWPDQNALTRSAEASMKASVPDEDVLAWFRWRDPVSRYGRLRFAELLMKQGQTERAVRLIRQAWVKDDFRTKDLRYVYRLYRQHLRAEDHVARLDRLVWENRRRDARRMYRYVDKGRQHLAEARLALRAYGGGVDVAISRVPEELRNDPGLMYERLRWRRRKGREADAREILNLAPDELGNAKMWWYERAFQIRNAIDEKLYDEAYGLASAHKQIDSSSFAEAEWLAGWIALRFVSNPRAAYRHFTRLHGAVLFPVSRARAGYWAGRAAEALGDLEGAALWYTEAARHRATYYGQLSAARVISANAPLIASSAEPDDLALESALRGHDLIGAIRFLDFLGHDRMVAKFTRHLMTLAKSPADYAFISELAHSIERHDLAISSAKEASRDGFVSIQRLYPVVPLEFALPEEKLEQSLVLAVTRQESSFDPNAKSSAGARGLMQLMPATARTVARRNGLHYARTSLTRDPDYNIRLGSVYMRGLIREFRGSYFLAIAAYNGGTRNVLRWLRENGDPRRDPRVDVVDWIEMIPFRETRNYVQRVLEGLQVYRWHTGKRVDVASIEIDLARGMLDRVLASRCTTELVAPGAPVADFTAHC